MADRTSAEIFGTLFTIFAEDLPGSTGRELAAKVWPKTFEYDFSPNQMGVDETLITLGLARLQVDPRWPEDGEVMHYAKRDLSGFEP